MTLRLPVGGSLASGYAWVRLNHSVQFCARKAMPLRGENIRKIKARKRSSLCFQRLDRQNKALRAMPGLIRKASARTLPSEFWLPSLPLLLVEDRYVMECLTLRVDAHRGICPRLAIFGDSLFHQADHVAVFLVDEQRRVVVNSFQRRFIKIR